MRQVSNKIYLFRRFFALGKKYTTDLGFIKKLKNKLPKDLKDKILARILKKTGGQYEQTIETLKDLDIEVWNIDE